MVEKKKGIHRPDKGHFERCLPSQQDTRAQIRFLVSPVEDLWAGNLSVKTNLSYFLYDQPTDSMYTSGHGYGPEGVHVYILHTLNSPTLCLDQCPVWSLEDGTSCHGRQTMMKLLWKRSEAMAEYIVVGNGKRCAGAGPLFFSFLFFFFFFFLLVCFATSHLCL